MQSPGTTARYLEAIHGGKPQVLREDFSGGGGICKAWVAAPKSKRRSAIAVDHDPAVLTRLAAFPGIRTVASDVLKAPDSADIIAAFNFPLGYWHDRASLIRYLKLCRGRLKPRGVFVADLYGGWSAFETTSTRRRMRTPRGLVMYEWEQREADPVTGLVRNAIHFSMPRTRTSKAISYKNAFTYHWRLWSIPELTDACLEAGFRSVDVYDSQSGALDHAGNFYARPLAHGEPLDSDWLVYVAARR